jgi:hypothetical protein
MVFLIFDRRVIFCVALVQQVAIRAEDFEPYDVITESDVLASACRFKAHSENPDAGEFVFGARAAFSAGTIVTPHMLELCGQVAADRIVSAGARGAGGGGAGYTGECGGGDSGGAAAGQVLGR